MSWYLLVAVVAGGVGWLGGWLTAHSAVAHECSEFGRFYVGKTEFVCRPQGDAE